MSFLNPKSNIKTLALYPMSLKLFGYFKSDILQFAMRPRNRCSWDSSSEHTTEYQLDAGNCFQGVLDRLRDG